MKPIDNEYWQNHYKIDDLLAIENTEPEMIREWISRRAETEEDFKTIFEREYRKSGEKIRDRFRKKHLAEVKAMFDTDREYWQPDWNSEELNRFADQYSRYIAFLERGAGEVELSLRQIALVCYYTGQQITPSNESEILKAYNPKRASGEKLMDRYREVLRKTNRINLTENRRTDSKRLKDLAIVIEYLRIIQSDTNLAEMEYSILESAIKETE